MTIAIVMLIGWIINIIINTFQIKNITGCSFALGAALLSSLTNSMLSKAENNTSKEHNTQQEENIELENITTENPIPKLPAPKPIKNSVKLLPTHTTARKTQTHSENLLKLPKVLKLTCQIMRIKFFFSCLCQLIQISFLFFPDLNNFIWYSDV